MKLLLTSTGITNERIKKKFFEMIGKEPEDTQVAYIPTAINISSVDNKRWAIDNLKRLDAMGIGVIDIIDISATTKDNWKTKIDRADAIYVEGGSPLYLKEQYLVTGFADLLKSEFRDKVYVGCSAGSSVLCRIMTKSSKEKPGYKIDSGLGFVDFSIRPHFLRLDRKQFTPGLIQQIAQEKGETIYAIDDETAISVENGNVEVISEGKWKKFEK